MHRWSDTDNKANLSPASLRYAANGAVAELGNILRRAIIDKIMGDGFTIQAWSLMSSLQNGWPARLDTIRQSQPTSRRYNVLFKELNLT